MSIIGDSSIRADEKSERVNIKNVNGGGKEYERDKDRDLKKFKDYKEWKDWKSKHGYEGYNKSSNNSKQRVKDIANSIQLKIDTDDFRDNKRKDYLLNMRNVQKNDLY